MAKDVRAGRAFIEMFLKQDRLQRDLRKSRMALTRITGVIAGVGAAFTAVGVAAAAGAAAGILKATAAAGDFAEAASKFETVFGNSASAVREWADEMAGQLGITRKEMLSTLSGFQDLFVPLGIDENIAEGMSKQLAVLAVDLASFNNMQVSDVVRDLQAAMTGSSETMKKYGSIVDAAAVKQELLNTNLDPKTATNAEKALARLAIIMRTTTAAQGDSLRTSDSWANTMKRIRTEMQETMVDIGEKFLPLMRSLGQVTLAAMQQVRDAIANALPDFEGLDDAVIKLAQRGDWERVGEIIGLQIKLGVRKGIGEELYDFLFSALPAAGKMGFAAAGQSVSTLAPPGTAQAALAIGAKALEAGGGSRDQRTQLMERRLDRLIELAQKEVEESTKNRKANENRKDGVFR